MDFQTLDRFADAANPVFAILLVAAAIFTLRKNAPLFLLKSVLAVALCQQLAKALQKSKVISGEFPSTHYAVALALAVSFLALDRKFWPFSAILALGYGALVVLQGYHTIPEMAGALFAVPLSAAIHAVGRKIPKKVAPN